MCRILLNSANFWYEPIVQMAVEGSNRFASYIFLAAGKKISIYG